MTQKNHTPEEETAPERELIWQDDARIAMIQPNIHKAKAVLQAAIDKYNAVEGIEPLTDVLIDNWMLCPDDEIEAQREYFYSNGPFATSHIGLGISTEKGMSLVDDKIPDLTPIKEAFAAYQTLSKDFYRERSAEILYGTFSYQDGILTAREFAVQRIIEDNQFHLEYPLEFEYKNAVQTLIDAMLNLETVAEKIHPVYMPFQPSSAVSYTTVLDKEILLAGIVKDTWGNIRKDSMTFNVEILRQLKQHLKALNKTA